MFIVGAENSFSVAYQALENPLNANYYKHAHETYELLLFVNGEAAYNIEGITYNLSPYDLIIIPPAHYHFLDLKGNSVYERFIINFQAEEINPALLTAFSCPRAVNISHETDLIKTFNRLIKYHSIFNNQDFMVAAKGCLYEMVVLINYINAPVYTVMPANPTINRILEYISQNINNPIAINDISNALYLSPSHIQNIFNTHMKIGIKAYINQKKILSAQAMIRSGDKPRAAALKVGFNDYATFYRAYKKFTASIPSTDSKTEY